MSRSLLFGLLALGCTALEPRFGDAEIPDAGIIDGGGPASSPVPLDDAELARLGRAIVRLDPDCTGLLIAPRLVLTAASCANGGPLRVMVGTDATAPIEVIAATEEIEHPDYCVGRDCPDPPNDVDLALWVLERPPVFALPYLHTAPAYVAGDDGPGGIEPAENASAYFFGEDDRLQRARCANVGFREASRGGELGELACASAVHGAGGPVFDRELRLTGVLRGPTTTTPIDSFDADDAIRRGDVRYTEWLEGQVASWATSLVLGRFDEGASEDLLFRNQDGHPSWTDRQLGGADPSFDLCEGELLIGDFNGDGREDLMCRRDERLVIHYSRGAGVGGRFSSEPDVDDPTGFCAGWIDAGDFDGDGWDDLLCRDEATRQLRILLNDRNSAHPFPADATVSYTRTFEGHVWCRQQLVVGDLNGDLVDDVVCHNAGVALYFRAGAAPGVLGAPESLPTVWCPPGATFAVGRADDDTNDDLICWDAARAIVRVWRAADGPDPFAGEGIQERALVDFCPEGERAIGDVDGDGRMDLVCYDPSSGQILVDSGAGAGAASYDGISEVRIPDVLGS
jgi:hypothetical protein